MEVTEARDKERKRTKKVKISRCHESVILQHHKRGSTVMRKRFSYMIYSRKIDICFLQETNLTCFGDSVASSFWGSKDVD